MQITLLQAVIIGLWTAFCYSGMLWGIFTNRALVLSFGVGIVCGDLKTALQCGAIAELAFMGFGVGAGGTVPPNPIGPGIIGTLMAITMDGVTPESALSLSIPFAVAIQFLQTAIYTVRAGAPESANNALKKQDFGKFRLHSNLTILLFALVGFLLGFLGAYSMDTLSKLVALVPAWLLKGLTVCIFPLNHFRLDARKPHKIVYFSPLFTSLSEIHYGNESFCIREPLIPISHNLF